MTEPQATYVAGDRASPERRQRRACGSCINRIDGLCFAMPPQMVMTFIHPEYGPQFESRRPFVGVDEPACRSLYQHDRRGVQPEAR